MDGLLEYEGRPVPWVAVWSDERVAPELELRDGKLTPVEPVRWVVRGYGMWLLKGPMRQTGVPDFGSTASARQRMCMERLLCQVCGSGLHKRDMHWVIPDGGVHPELWEERLVINAPVCGTCLHLAERVCPHLVRHKPVAVVPARRSTYTFAEVTGTYVEGNDRYLHNVRAPLYHPMCQQMLGRELIVKVGA